MSSIMEFTPFVPGETLIRELGLSDLACRLYREDAALG